MTRFAFVILAAAIAATATGCKKEVETVSFETLETARKQARENAELNAKAFRAQMPELGKFNIMSRGDSSQTPNCPQGDGWATIDLVNDNLKVVGTLKCSTVSDSIGCRTSDSFRASQYVNDDGQCQPVSKVPHPIPKLVK